MTPNTPSSTSSGSPCTTAPRPSWPGIAPPIFSASIWAEAVRGRGQGDDAVLSSPTSLDLFGQFAHHLDQIGFALKADSREVRHHDMTVLDPHGVGEAAIGLKQVRVA